MHSKAADIAGAQLNLAGVQPHPYLEPDAAQLVSEGSRAADSAAGTIEGGENSVTGRLL